MQLVKKTNEIEMLVGVKKCKYEHFTNYWHTSNSNLAILHTFWESTSHPRRSTYNVHFVRHECVFVCFICTTKSRKCFSIPKC